MAISKLKLATKMRKKASGKQQVFSSRKEGKRAENRKDNQRKKKRKRRIKVKGKERKKKE